jgi:hypothetical protein
MSALVAHHGLDPTTSIPICRWRQQHGKGGLVATWVVSTLLRQEGPRVVANPFGRILPQTPMLVPHQIAAKDKSFP